MAYEDKDFSERRRAHIIDIFSIAALAGAYLAPPEPDYISDLFLIYSINGLVIKTLFLRIADSCAADTEHDLTPPSF